MLETLTPTKQPELQKWIMEIDRYSQTFAHWEKRCKNIIKRYIDEREGIQDEAVAKYNALWANVQTMLPALYSQLPKPEIERRFNDHDDKGRVASEVLQRVVAFQLADTGASNVFRQVMLDHLLCGRGTLWVRFVPHTKSIPDESISVTDDGQEAPTVDIVEWAEVLCDYVHWQDFGHTQARTWEEVTALWRKVAMTRDELVERFGEDLGNKIPLDYKDDSTFKNDHPGATAYEAGTKATIYEIWDKSTKEAIWISKNFTEILDKRDDPLKLKNFWPCPKPLYSTLTNEQVIPTPDYVLYQDQANQLDQLTGRITSITRTIKVAGGYNAAAPALQRILNEGMENTLVPVESWGAFAETGGIAGNFQLFPMQEVANTLLSLYDARERVKADMYEITGISDLMRGDTEASETATAQAIKSSYGAVRWADRKAEVNRFFRETIQIITQIVAEFMPDDLIKTISGMKLAENPVEKQVIVQLQQQQNLPKDIDDETADSITQNPTWVEVLPVMRDNAARTFRMDIETDSTIAADEAQEKADRTEFLSAVAQFLQQALPAGQQFPPITPLLGSMLLFGVRAFRIGRGLEGEFEAFIAQMRKMSANGQAAPQNPEMIKAQMQMQSIQAKSQADQQMLVAKAKIDAQTAQQKAVIDAQADMMRARTDLAVEQNKKQMDAQMVAHQAAVESQRNALQAQQEMKLEQMRMLIEQQNARQDRMMQLILASINNRAKIEVAEIGANATLQAGQIAAASMGGADGS